MAGMSDSLVTTGFALGNVASSVAIVLVNKKVFAGGFHFPCTLSFFHFCFTVVFYKLMAACALFEVPNPDLSQFEKFKVGFVGVASIGFMNVSLALNSVGFYQVTKLTIVPVTLVISYMCYGESTSNKIKLSLAILLAGVGIATVSDVELRPLGLVFGIMAVLSTAVFQIWQGTKQKEHKVNGTQLQHSVAIWQTLQALAAAAVFESVCYTPPPVGACDSATAFIMEAMDPISGTAKMQTLWLVLVTCFLALAVNWCSFGLIGRTGPITFQVVGHAKTCLVLAGGFVLFPNPNMTESQMMHNIACVSVAMVGVILYGHIKYAVSADKDDCLDCVCPGPIVRMLDPKYSSVNDEETAGFIAASSGKS